MLPLDVLKIRKLQNCALKALGADRIVFIDNDFDHVFVLSSGCEVVKNVINSNLFIQKVTI